MPPLPELAGTVEAVFGWAGPGGVAAINRFYLLTTGNPTQQDMTGLANGLFTAMAPNNTAGIMYEISNGWTLESVTCTQLTAPYLMGVSTNAPVTGGQGGYTTPQTALCISWAGPYRYRGGKPRSYIPGVPSGSLATSGGALVTAAYAEAQQTNFNTFLSKANALAPSGGGTWALGLLRRISGHQGSPPKPIYMNPPQFFPFTGCSVNTRVASQRRRNGKLQKVRV